MNQQISHIVLGLGATGLSVVRYLVSQGITPVVMDSRATPPSMAQLQQNYPEVKLFTGEFDSTLLCQAQQIVISPGISLQTPAVQRAISAGVEVIGDVELFARAITERPPCVIAITGSNGKTTVTTLVAEMAKTAGVNYAVGGNIGIPVLSLLEKPHDLYILELSSFQLETTHSLQCITATCLNISEDHMDRYDSLEAYRQTKLSIYTQSKRAVYNRDDLLTKPNVAISAQHFGCDIFDAQNTVDSQSWGMDDKQLFHGQKSLIALADIALVGRHNYCNLLAAMALCSDAHIPLDAMLTVAKSFTGLSHRCEKVITVDHITYVNDSKATNVGACLAALSGFAEQCNKIILIAGGDAKGADLTPLTAPLSSIKQLITLGVDGAAIGLLKANSVHVDSMAQAVSLAYEQAVDGDIVLLSPACASLDMYPNFMARGDDFTQQVLRLTQVERGA